MILTAVLSLADAAQLGSVWAATPQQIEQAQELINQANRLLEQGGINEAAKLWERAVKIVEEQLGDDHPDVASGLDALAGLYQHQGQYGVAESLFKRALQAREKGLGPDHPDTATSLNNLALLYDKQGLYGDAEPLYKRALLIFERTLGPEHPSTAVSLNNLALLYSHMGRYGDAEPLYKRALLINEKAEGPEHPSVATVLSNLAELHRDQGHYEEARLLHKRALQIRETVLGPDHPDTATSLNNLALLDSNIGRYGDAEPLYKRARMIRERVLGPGHPDTAASLNNLAFLYEQQGRYGEAEPLYKSALLIYERALGPGHPSTASNLSNLASLYRSMGRYEDAEPLYKRALLVVEKALGAEHPLAATVTNNLALVYSDQGRYREAEMLYQRVLLSREKALGSEHSDVATSLNNLASLYLAQGRYGEAEPLYQRALLIREIALGPQHPETAITLNNFALLNLLQNQPAAAVPLLTRLSRSQAEWQRRELPLQPRDLRQSQMQIQPDAVASTFALLHLDPSAAPLALETRLNRQGLLAEIEQRQRLLLGSSAETRSLGERLGGLDRQLASVTLQSAQREQLRAERLQLEAELNRRLPALRIEPVSTDQVAVALRQLAAAGLLVEFQRYRPWQQRRGGGGEWGSPRYVALLLKPDGAILTIPLGEAEPIDTAITAAVVASADPARQHQAGEALVRVSQLLLTPLQPQLAGVKELFLSPDGELNRLPFAALPMPGPGGQLLAEAVALRLLTTGRELLRLQQPGRAGGSAVLMANPAFDASARSAALPATAASVGSAGGQRRSAGLRGRTWQRLPGTAAEARQLSPLLQVSQPLTGREATAAAALRQQGPRIFHIATHGFFEADQQQGDPLLRSGLVFAGANQPDADPADDGYLTAAEATAMALEGTELVTLSACETGLGDVRSGEGVYGLQRSLAVAGARSTLLSLWQVEDELTSLFMVQFYRRLMAGQSRADALRDTQRAFRSESLERLVSMGASGQDGGKQRGSLAVVSAEKRSGHAVAKHNSVYVWGAFQLSGDWRPLPGH